MATDRDARLRELEDNEHHALETLRKLNYPSSVLDHIWWAATWFSNTRSAWRSGANRALDQIREEREQLKKKQ